MWNGFLSQTERPMRLLGKHLVIPRLNGTMFLDVIWICLSFSPVVRPHLTFDDVTLGCGKMCLVVVHSLFLNPPLKMCNSKIPHYCLTVAHVRGIRYVISHRLISERTCPVPILSPHCIVLLCWPTLRFRCSKYTRARFSVLKRWHHICTRFLAHSLRLKINH